MTDYERATSKAPSSAEGCIGCFGLVILLTGIAFGPSSVLAAITDDKPRAPVLPLAWAILLTSLCCCRVGHAATGREFRASDIAHPEHARAVFRNEARVIELAERLSSSSRYPQLMLWVAWLVITADNRIGDDETLRMKHLVRVVRDQHLVVDDQLANVVDIDPSDV